jgi:CDGSH-type Zn-finger protein
MRLPRLAQAGSVKRRSGSRRPVSVTVCPGGPLLVRGADEVIDAEGTSHEVRRPCVAVCRCGRTSIPPWCDGTHKMVTAEAAQRSG